MIANSFISRTAATLLPIALALNGCASMRHSPHKPQPGYWCSITPNLPEGVGLFVALDTAGRQLNAEWDWRVDLKDKQLEIWASDSVFNASPLIFNEADIIINWRRNLLKPNERFGADELHLEIAGSGSEHPPLTGHGSRVDVKWPVLAALARTSPILSVTMRKSDGTTVYQMNVPSDVITRRDAMIEQAQKRMRTLIADYQKFCEFTQDVSPEIIVT